MTPQVAKTYFEKEVEPQERAAGDDGEAGGVPAGDGLGHVRGVLEERAEGPTEQGCGSGLLGLDTGEDLMPQELINLLPPLCPGSLRCCRSPCLLNSCLC